MLYVSGEESGEQVALRARRLGLDTRRLQLMAEINLERILATLQAEKPVVAVIDSIQTLWSDQLSSAPGSVAQVRECAAQLTRLAKQVGITVILVGHVTKEGALAGPRVLEHIVLSSPLFQLTVLPLLFIAAARVIIRILGSAASARAQATSRRVADALGVDVLSASTMEPEPIPVRVIVAR